ncbi:MAG: TonB family protein [Bacteriovoracia bacterium]
MNVWERDRTWYSDDFKSSFMLAIAMHLFLILVAFIVGRVVQKTMEPDAAMEIMRAAVRVDVVGMPKMTIQELRQLQMPAEAPSEEPKLAEATKVEETAVAPKPDDLVMPSDKPSDAKPGKSFANFLQEYSNKKIKVSNTAVKGDRSGKAQGLDSLIIEGNRLSKGTALTGDISEMSNSVFVGYVQTLPEKVREHWKLPGFLREKDLKCRVHVWIGARGEILKTQIRESSGNSEFDSKAEAALRAAAPFAPPPTEASALLSGRGVILGFPL